MFKKVKVSSGASNDIAADAADNKSGFAKWLPMVILSLALMIIIVDTTVLNVSLKDIAHDLNTNLVGLQWVISAYSLTLAALTITGGRLGDLFGRKKMFMLGAVIFAIGSFITSISHSVNMMLVGESIIEGIGAALMMPATASLLVANYKGRDRGIAFGIWGGIAGAAAAIGPIIGGFLTTNYSWRWAFRINIFVVIILLLGSLVISESRDRAEKQELDFLGIFLSAGGLLALVYGIIEASTFGWLTARLPFAIFGHYFAPLGLSITPIAIAIGLIMLTLFILWEKRVEDSGHTPLVSLHLLTNSQFTSGTVVVSLLSLGMVGLIFAVPVFLQSVRNLDALHTGLALLPMSIAMLIVAPTSAMLNKWFTAKRVIQTGLLLTVIASFVLHSAITATATAANLVPGLIIFGIGMGMVMAQASNLTLSAVSVQQAGEASGVNNTVRQIGSTFGSALIGAVLLTALASNLSSGIQSSTVIPQAMKPQIAKSIAQSSANIELGGVNSDRKAAALPPAIDAELTKIAHEASAKGSSKAIMYTGIFGVVALAASTFLPNTHDLEERGRKSAIAAGH